MTRMEDRARQVFSDFCQDHRLPPVAWLMGVGDVLRLTAEQEGKPAYPPRGPLILMFLDLPIYTIEGFTGIALLDHQALSAIG